MTELKKALDFAVDIAHSAGQITLGYFQHEIDIELKNDNSPVTIADKKAEEFIRSKIEKQYPQAGILGEEFGESNENSSHKWIIDPIDGTKSFMRGVPLYSVLIALEIEGKVELGVSYFPALNEMLFAARDQGAYFNGRRAYVSQVNELKKAVFAFTDVANFNNFNRTKEWELLKTNSYYRAGWGDAYGHALVATGRVEAMFDPIMNPWDCGPFAIILKEAGGYFGNWSGQETIYGNEAMSINGGLLEPILSLIND
ncbi:MAG TPA: histidinol phosphate phosphatase [Trueperaceae bacterium]|nr:histidinol phosphate phosphatase [Trueperaceae bacterium]